MAYNTQIEAKRGRKMKVKFIGVDDDTLPEKYYKGKKSMSIDGDTFEYQDFVNFTTVPEAFEFLIDVETYFKSFKVIKTGDKSCKGVNDYKMARSGTSTAFPTLKLIRVLFLTFLFAYFSFFNPDPTSTEKNCENNAYLMYFFQTYFWLRIAHLFLTFARHFELLNSTRTGKPTRYAKILNGITQIFIFGVSIWATVLHSQG